MKYGTTSDQTSFFAFVFISVDENNVVLLNRTIKNNWCNLTEEMN